MLPASSKHEDPTGQQKFDGSLVFWHVEYVGSGHVEDCLANKSCRASEGIANHIAMSTRPRTPKRPIFPPSPSSLYMNVSYMDIRIVISRKAGFRIIGGNALV